MQRDAGLHALDALHKRGDGLKVGIGGLGTHGLEEVEELGGIGDELHVLSVNLGGDGDSLDACDGEHELRVLDGPSAS